MDQHPIPQDVTGFQFKLVGSMTVKQFGYVAVGVVSAAILYYLPLPLPIFLASMVKLFLIPLFGSSGFIIAFIPIEGRPIDVMATNFAKAIFSPNQYVYRKQGRRFSFTTLSLAAPTGATPTPTQANSLAYVENRRKSKQLQEFLSHSTYKHSTVLDQREAAFLNTLSTMPLSSSLTPPAPKPTLASPPQPAMPVAGHTPSPVATLQAQPLPKPTAPLPKPAPLTMPVTQPIAPVTTQPTATTTKQPTPELLAQEETRLSQQLIAAKQEEATKQTPAETATAHIKVQALEHQVAEIHRQKQQLEQELMQLKTQLHAVKEAPAAPLAQATTQPAPQTQPLPQPAPQAAPQVDPQHVRSLSQDVTKKAGLPHVPDTPNVVVGIVKDPRGNVLPNILVEVKDKEGNPVRAFKTNPLGQFASATPLSPGTYTIELEDPKKQQQFDVIQVTTNNQIMLPIEIISHDAREELRRQLFAN